MRRHSNKQRSNTARVGSSSPLRRIVRRIAPHVARVLNIDTFLTTDTRPRGLQLQGDSTRLRLEIPEVPGHSRDSVLMVMNEAIRSLADRPSRASVTFDPLDQEYNNTQRVDLRSSQADLAVQRNSATACERERTAMTPVASQVPSGSNAVPSNTHASPAPSDNWDALPLPLLPPTITAPFTRMPRWERIPSRSGASARPTRLRQQQPQPSNVSASSGGSSRSQRHDWEPAVPLRSSPPNSNLDVGLHPVHTPTLHQTAATSDSSNVARLEHAANLLRGDVTTSSRTSNQTRDSRGPHIDSQDLTAPRKLIFGPSEREQQRERAEETTRKGYGLDKPLPILPTDLTAARPHATPVFARTPAATPATPTTIPVAPTYGRDTRQYAADRVVNTRENHDLFAHPQSTELYFPLPSADTSPESTPLSALLHMSLPTPPTTPRTDTPPNPLDAANTDTPTPSTIAEPPPVLPDLRRFTPLSFEWLVDTSVPQLPSTGPQPRSQSESQSHPQTITRTLLSSSNDPSDTITLTCPRNTAGQWQWKRFVDQDWNDREHEQELGRERERARRFRQYDER